MTKTSWHLSIHLMKFLLIGAVVFFTLMGGGLLLFAQSAPSATHTLGTVPTQTLPLHPTSQQHATQAAPSQKKTAEPTTPPVKTPSPSVPPTPIVTQPTQPPQNKGEQGPTGMETVGSSIPSAQLLNALGWTQAGLSASDAFEALRTAITFTDREMSYDYRNIGTLAHHSGTLTGSVFLLTPGGKMRFTQHDVRAINNVLYTKIQTNKIIQQVVNPQATLVHLQVTSTQGQTSLFTWVDVSFQLFQSTIDPASGQRTEGLEHDPATGQPRTHLMHVVLVRVALQQQGTNPPMGGTGWLVNTYARDTSALPPLETSPSI